MNAHVIGVVDPSVIGRCTYRSPEFPSGCLAPASWHGIDRNFRYGIMTCDPHQKLMESLVYWVHELTSACGLPRTRFVVPDNRCEIDWEAFERQLQRYGKKE